MFTILFLDEEYEKFDYNIIDDSSIVFTKCFNQEFLNTLYIKGIKTIMLLRPFSSFIKTEEAKEAKDGEITSIIDYAALVEIIGVMPDLIITKQKLKSDNVKEPVVVDITKITKITNTSEFKLSSLIGKSIGLERKKSESYENLVKLVDENKEIFVQVEDSPDKFQKTMEKEAIKLKYAENREKYMIKMRQSSLSNKKSTSKSSITSDPSTSLGKDKETSLTASKSFISGAKEKENKEKKKKKIIE